MNADACSRLLRTAQRLLCKSDDRVDMIHEALLILAEATQTKRLVFLRPMRGQDVYHVEGFLSGRTFIERSEELSPQPELDLSRLATKRIQRLPCRDYRGVPLPAAASTAGMHTSLALPILAADTSFLGVVLIDLEEQSPPDDTSLERLRMLASVIAIGLENMQRFARAVQTSEARYRAIVDNSTVMICRFRPSGKLTFVNDTFCRYFKRPRAVVLGKTFDLAIRASDRKLFDELMQSLTPDMATREIQFQLESGTGKQRWNHWTIQPVRDIDAPSLEYQAVGRDITLQRLAEQDRRHLEERMLDAQKFESLGMLAGGVAHDFNNLLATVLGNTELALEAPDLSEEMQEYLGDIRKATLRASQLSQQMLTYAGHQPVHLKPLNLNESIRQVQQLYEANLSSKTEISYALDDALPYISGDPSQIRQVLINLVTNAEEALESKARRIHISTGIQDLKIAGLRSMTADPDLSAGTYVFAKVADSGSGIAPETMRQLFEPFYTTKFIGRGLGLAAVHGIVRAHRGAIYVQSDAGTGSSFTVYFPLPPSPSQVASPAAATTQAVKRAGKVLIVDDEEGVRQIVSYVLKRTDYEVLNACDGVEALNTVKAHRNEISVILLDLKMPRMSGEEAYVAIRKLAPEIPIVIMTGYTEDSVFEAFQGDRPNGFIQKPFEVKHLIQTIKNIA